MPLPPNYQKESWMHEHQSWHFFAFIAIGALAITVLFFADLRFSREYEALQSAPLANSKKVRIQIEFESEKRAFEGKAEDNLTLHAALAEIADIANLSMDIENDEIAAIGTVKNEEKDWKVYLNDVPLSDPLSYALKGGDRITLRYE